MKEKMGKKITINTDKKSTNVNMKRIVEKKFKKKKENFRYTTFEDFVVKDLNEQVLAKHYTNDITLFFKHYREFFV